MKISPDFFNALPERVPPIAPEVFESASSLLFPKEEDS